MKKALVLIMDNATACEIVHNTIQAQPVLPMLATKVKEVSATFEENLETECTFKGDYYQPAEYDLAPGEEQRKIYFTAALEIIAPRVQEMCHRLVLKSLDESEDVRDFLAGDSLWTLIEASLEDCAGSHNAACRHFNAQTKAAGPDPCTA